VGNIILIIIIIIIINVKINVAKTLQGHGTQTVMLEI